MSEVLRAIARAQAAQARSLGYRDAGARYNPTDGGDLDSDVRCDPEVGHRPCSPPVRNANGRKDGRT
jgi:hypothetical protein